MPLNIVKNDITKIKCNAIVNAANSTLLGGGGVDGAIHAAAGPELLAECKTLGGCATGEAKITGGYNLSAKYVIHTVGPIYRGGTQGERSLLSACYRNSLELAVLHNCKSVAFPLISAGAYGYPREEALDVAMNTISEFLCDHDMLVYLVVFDKSSFKISQTLATDIKNYIVDNYIDRNAHITQGERKVAKLSRCIKSRERSKEHIEIEQCSMYCEFHELDQVLDPRLRDAVNSLDESFSQMLLRKIDEKGMSDAECYKKANVDRKHFSKIRSNNQYRPKKRTIIAFAIALELSLDETKELLQKAGFALSQSKEFDVIIEYFIKKGNYDINLINAALFEFDQSLLGA